MKLEDYIKRRGEAEKGKYRTINLDEDLHLFLKRVANHYNISLADLTYNILSQWKEQHKKEIQEDMTRSL